MGFLWTVGAYGNKVTKGYIGDKGKSDELRSKLLVSLLVSPTVVPYIVPHITPLRSLDYSTDEKEHGAGDGSCAFTGVCKTLNPKTPNPKP